MPSCSVFRCRNRSAKGGNIRYFRFPKEESLVAKWLHVCRKNSNVKNGRVCSIHFLPSDYVKSIRHTIMNESPTKIRTLKPDAIPSLNIDDTREMSPERENVLISFAGDSREILFKKENVITEHVNDAGDSKEVLIKRENVLTEDGNVAGDSKEILIERENVLTKDGNVAGDSREILIKRENVLTEDGNVAGDSKEILIKRENVLTEDINVAHDSRDIFIKRENAITDHVIAGDFREISIKREYVGTIDVNIAGDSREMCIKRKKLLTEDVNVAGDSIELLIKRDNLITGDVNVARDSRDMAECSKNREKSSGTVNISIEEYNNLKKKIFKLEKQRDDFQKNLGRIFTPGQIRSLLGCSKRRVRWSAEDISAAKSLRSISPKGYRYLRNTVGLPLPAISTLCKWAATTPCRSDSSQCNNTNEVGDTDLVCFQSDNSNEVSDTEYVCINST